MEALAEQSVFCCILSRNTSNIRQRYRKRPFKPADGRPAEPRPGPSWQIEINHPQIELMSCEIGEIRNEPQDTMHNVLVLPPKSTPNVLLPSPSHFYPYDDHSANPGQCLYPWPILISYHPQER